MNIQKSDMPVARRLFLGWIVLASVIYFSAQTRDRFDLYKQTREWFISP
jgi:hypothetical protein